MSDIKLVLNTGDTVRNIRPNSSLKGWVGTVSQTDKIHYRVTYQNGHVSDYLRTHAHESLEKLVSEDRQRVKLATFAQRYGSYLSSEAAGKLWAELLKTAKGTEMIIDFDNLSPGVTGVHYVHQEVPKRRVLKKVRRNVLTGKTQEDHVKMSGHAKGVQEFNTRALGKSTGQALHAIGSAMMNPGTEIRISHIDHAKGNPLCSTSWTTLDKHFRNLVQSLIGNMKGFTFTDTHIVFNPIVTEETYVEL